ncbi:MAG: hypothetical protein QW409_02235 [Candidatus Aenigmatarchaeota archaeon]
MIIVGWNCNGNFEKKLAFCNNTTKKELIQEKFKPDIMVILECEKRKDENDDKYIWYGENKNRGVAVYMNSQDYSIEFFEGFNKEFKYVVPIRVKGKIEFVLIAVWTQKVGRKNEEYLGQLTKALEYYEENFNLLKEPVIIIGDFNMDKTIEERYKYKYPASLTELVDFLRKRGIESVYHKFFKEEFGKETRPTFFHRNPCAGRFHTDYCFVSKFFLEKLKKVEVGKCKEWIIHSDHMPIVIEFENL